MEAAAAKKFTAAETWNKLNYSDQKSKTDPDFLAGKKDTFGDKSKKISAGTHFIKYSAVVVAQVVERWPRDPMVQSSCPLLLSSH